MVSAIACGRNGISISRLALPPIEPLSIRPAAGCALPARKTEGLSGRAK